MRSIGRVRFFGIPWWAFAEAMPPTNTTPLHAACRSGDVDMVWILRKKWELKKTGGLGEPHQITGFYLEGILMIDSCLFDANMSGSAYLHSDASCLILCFQLHIFTSWWQLKYVLFSPLPRDDSHFDEHIFQLGWFNHQPVYVQHLCSSYLASLLNISWFVSVLFRSLLKSRLLTTRGGHFCMFDPWLGGSNLRPRSIFRKL